MIEQWHHCCFAPKSGFLTVDRTLSGKQLFVAAERLTI